MAEHFNCGFVRATLLTISKTIASAHVVDVAHQTLRAQFGNDHEKGNFKNLFKKFMGKVRNKKWKQDEKNEYLAYFSNEKWNELGDEEWESHSISKCTQCELNHSAMHHKFPLNCTKKVLKDVTNTKTTECSRRTKEKAGELWEKVNEEWVESGETTSLNQVWATMPRTKLVKRKTGNENLSDLRKIQTEIRDHEQDIRKKNDRDLNTVLATRQSFNRYGQQRKLDYFEK